MALDQEEAFGSRLASGMMLRGLDVRVPYFYPWLHASLHGVPSWLADAANLLWKEGRHVHARWLAKCRGNVLTFVLLRFKSSASTGEL